MIPLPPGCTVGYEIRFMVNELTDDMGEWFLLQGGQAWASEEYDHRGRRKLIKHVKYGHAKPSYVTQDGTGITLIRFNGIDAPLANIFLIKFFNQIKEHNMSNYQDHE